MNAEIYINPEGSLVTIEIVPRYATLGTYNMALIHNGQVAAFGPQPGKLGDAVPDKFIVPLLPQLLLQARLAIVGTYVPSPGHTQISVSYNFSQDGLSRGEINIQQNGGVATPNHLITFKSL